MLDPLKVENTARYRGGLLDPSSIKVIPRAFNSQNTGQYRGGVRNKMSGWLNGKATVCKTVSHEFDSRTTLDDSDHF